MVYIIINIEKAISLYSASTADDHIEEIDLKKQERLINFNSQLIVPSVYHL